MFNIQCYIDQITSFWDVWIDEKRLNALIRRRLKNLEMDSVLREVATQLRTQIESH